VITEIDPSSKNWVRQWIVVSPTSGHEYKVSQKVDASFACSCPAWKFKKAPKPPCKHIAYVQANVGVDTRDVAVILAEAGIKMPPVRTATAITQHREQAEANQRRAAAAAWDAARDAATAAIQRPAPPSTQPVFLLQTQRKIMLAD